MHGSAFALFHNTPKIGILLHKEGFVESGKHCIQKIPSQASYIKFVRFFHRITIPYFMVIRYSRVPIPLQRALYDSRSHFHGNFFKLAPSSENWFQPWPWMSNQKLHDHFQKLKVCSQTTQSTQTLSLISNWISIMFQSLNVFLTLFRPQKFFKRGVLKSLLM